MANNSTSKHIITLDCGPDGVELSRDAEVDFTIMVPAGTLENGFTVKVVGDVSWPSYFNLTDETIYEKSVEWSSGQMPDFIVRSRLSKVETAMEVVPNAHLTYYTVFYLDRETREILPSIKQVFGLEAGATVAEAAIEIPGYTLWGPSEEQSLELSENPWENDIIFEYDRTPEEVEFKVYYTDFEIGEDVAAPLTMRGSVGETMILIAESVDGYDYMGSAETNFPTLQYLDLVHDRIRIELTVTPNAYVRFWYIPESPDKNIPE